MVTSTTPAAPERAAPKVISLPQARRIALAGQQFGGPRATEPSAVTMRQVQRVIDRLGQFQIDSINVVARAHLMPLFSRLGAYDPALLQRAAHRKPRRLFEYWGHAASMIDVNLQPALRFRMDRAQHEAWGGMRRINAEQPQLLDRVRVEVADHGPITARQIEHDEVRDRSDWGWNWSSVKTAMEYLFWAGEITSAQRNAQFERAFDLPEKVLPPHIAQAPTPTEAEAVLALVRRSAEALGIATRGCLADYFRLSVAQTQAAIDTLVETGELIGLTVTGIDKPCYLWHTARRPRRMDARALVSPFDSMVFERNRVKLFFDFDYRIEIYVPEPKRRYGYYVYPFLLGEEIVARVDLKADRAAGVLRVKAAWLEPGQSRDEVAPELQAELELMASWLGLTRVESAPLLPASALPAAPA